MSYIGNEPIVSATRTITEVTATAGQTVFVANGGYTVGYIDVFLNGAQLQTVDFTATDGSTITLTEAAQVGDVLKLVAWGTFSTSNLVSPNYTGTLTGGTGVVNLGSGQFYKDSSGNIGVGTSSPTAKLSVGALTETVPATYTGTLKVQGSPQTTLESVGGIELPVAGDGYSFKIQQLSASGAALSFANRNGSATWTERMRIDSSGNVGIGTSSPVAGYRLTLNGAAAGIYMQATSGTARNWAFGAGIASNAGELSFYDITAGAERMRIDSSGNLLVGTTGLPQLNATTGTGFGVVNNSSLRLNLTPGVEGCAYNYTNYINGTTVYPVVFRTNGNTVGYISMTNTAVAYVTSSDYRLKENIAPMTGALAKVAKLKPVTYQWKTDGSSGQGFIAHELQEVVPDCVTGEKDAVETYTDEDGTEQVRPRYQGIDTSFLVATLTAAIQEQQAIITELKSRVEALENK